MKFTCTMRLWGSFVSEVEAKSVEEAQKKADAAWKEADFGDATEIDGELVKVEAAK